MKSGSREQKVKEAKGVERKGKQEEQREHFKTQNSAYA
jgi:hypothetical protein